MRSSSKGDEAERSTPHDMATAITITAATIKTTNKISPFCESSIMRLETTWQGFCEHSIVIMQRRIVKWIVAILIYYYKIVVLLYL